MSAAAPESDDESKDKPRTFPFLVTRVLVVLSIMDLMLAYVLYQTWPAQCDASARLKTWLVGGLFLSWPASVVVSMVAEQKTLRWAFAVDALFLAVGFVWLCAGSAWCWLSADCMEIVPLLFWPVFSITVVVWSALITVWMCLICSTVLTV
eukprot:CAMPEP_0179113038 /NCGR_PEP_ID=MMETSP0796-20121207/52869_1 /TAXON_ID=73915 /ORGANISM="Pyrodinium bahamense, Strain pbaha01" /LENGTH=150 /DNA_ID=CAMNT_0020811227 /DNA_START=78 /DNA_END=527 /DNA_ORIENTATION=-